MPLQYFTLSLSPAICPPHLASFAGKSHRARASRLALLDGVAESFAFGNALLERLNNADGRRSGSTGLKPTSSKPLAAWGDLQIWHASTASAFRAVYLVVARTRTGTRTSCTDEPRRSSLVTPRNHCCVACGMHCTCSWRPLRAQRGSPLSAVPFSSRAFFGLMIVVASELCQLHSLSCATLRPLSSASISSAWYV